MASPTPPRPGPSSPPESPISSASPTETTDRKNEVHFVIQGKGGVGKSLVATLLAEFLRERIADLRCFDTDPVNPTFASYAEFGVRRIELFEGSTINAKAFDGMMIAMLDAGASAVVDNGATTFIPLMNYIAQSGVFEVLLGAGKQVFVHIIVAGGDAVGETVDGFAQIMAALPADVKAIVWLNALHGEVDIEGVEFERTAIYRKVQDQVAGIVPLPAPASDLFARDLQDLRRKRVSFKAAMDGSGFNVMERQRFSMVRRDLFARMAAVL